MLKQPPLISGKRILAFRKLSVPLLNHWSLQVAAGHGAYLRFTIALPKFPPIRLKGYPQAAVEGWLTALEELGDSLFHCLVGVFGDSLHYVAINSSPAERSRGEIGLSLILNGAQPLPSRRENLEKFRDEVSSTLTTRLKLNISSAFVLLPLEESEEPMRLQDCTDCITDYLLAKGFERQRRNSGLSSFTTTLRGKTYNCASENGLFTLDKLDFNTIDFPASGKLTLYYYRSPLIVSRAELKKIKLLTPLITRKDM